MIDEGQEDAVLDEACARLYSSDPADFVAVRTELSRQARQRGDGAAATAISALRKPTSSAAIVNRHVLANPAVREHLAAVGDRLRAAQGNPDGVDRTALRELSDERRRLVNDTVDAALAGSDLSPGPAVRDEVRETLDAAVADPGVAARLGRLTHGERWSGFGVAPAGGEAPALRVVAGGKTEAPRPATRASRQSPPSRTRQRELDAAEQKLADTLDDAASADEQVTAARGRVEQLREQLERLQQELGAAERAVKDAVGAQRSGRSRLREARAARDRAARRAER